MRAFLASAAAASSSSITTFSSEDTTSATTRALVKSKKSTGDPQDENKKKLYSDSAGMQRFLSQARATFMNVEDVQSLSPEEFIFLEDTMREMYEAVYGVSVKNLIVTSAEKSDLDPAGTNSSKKKKKYSGLRRSKNHNSSNDGNRDLVWNSFGGGFSWFDFSAFFEVTCTLCDPEDDDDDFYFGGGDRKLSSSSDSDDDFDFEELRREKLNTKLCEALRAGPFESFWNVQGCQIIMG